MITQLYVFSALLLIAVASALALNAIDLLIVSKIIVGCFSIIGFYSAVWRVSGRREIAALVMVGALMMLPLIPQLRYAVYFIGLLGIITLFLNDFKICLKNFIFLPVAFASIFGAGLHSNFLYKNSLLEGAKNIDAFFHAAIAAMYKNYGISSIGLDGLIPIKYHTLSHKIISGAATLGGFESLAGYAYLYFALGPLLLIFCLAALARQLNSKLQLTYALLGSSLLILAIVALPIFARVALWDSFFVSESYLLGLVCFLVSLSILLRWIEDGASDLTLLVTSLIFIVLAGLAKGSIGIVGICVFYIFGITRFRYIKYWMLVTIASAALYFALMDAATAAKQLNPISPFNFIKTFINFPFSLSATSWGKGNFFIFFHFLPIWLCFETGIRKAGYLYFKTNEFQVLVSLVIPALFFSLAFDLAGGAAYYFSSIPVLVSLPFLLSKFPHFVEAIKFRYVILLVLLSTVIMEDSIRRKMFVGSINSRIVPVEGLSPIVRQLQNIRENTTINTLIKIENPEILVEKIGCNAYWFLPALMERPLIDGLPSKKLCPDISDSFYGLSDYKINDKKPLISKNFKIVPVRLGLD